MLKITQIVLFLFIFQGVNSQTLIKDLASSKLGENRQIMIQLPRGYDSNSEKEYPVIIVLDGNYLFEPMAGNVDYYSYWDEIPESIVVGIDQASTRKKDCLYDDRRFLPTDTGAAFFEFIGMELLPYINENYNTAKFTVLAGHDYTANFINYFLLKEEPIFQGYINLSPDLAPEMANRLLQKFETLEEPVWFYMATSSEDIPFIREAVLKFDQQLKTVENKNFYYSFNDLEFGNHYSMVGKSIPDALENIFHSYGPITTEEYDTEIVNSEISPLEYLEKKYETIEDYYGIEIPMRTNDIMAIGKALEFNQYWEDLEDLGKLALEHHPKSMLGIYYLARSYEARGEPKKAMRTYEAGYGKEEIAYLTVDFMLNKAELIKKDFGY